MLAPTLFGKGNPNGIKVYEEMSAQQQGTKTG